MEKDFYKILGVSDSSKPDEIKRAFRRLAKELHPDRNPGDKEKERRFKEISEAYDVLSDDKKRAEYDTIRRFGAADGQHFGGQSWGSRPGQGGFTFEGVGDLGDIFGSMFGPQTGNRRRRGARTMGADSFGANPFNTDKGQDTSAELTVTFEEALHGSKKQVVISDSSGSRKTVNVTIPQGIESGEKIRLRGLGSPGYDTAPAGDLIVTVSVEPHPRFTRIGSDIKTIACVPFRTAVLGGKATVETLTGKVSLTIPAGTQSGTVMRLRGQGAKLGGKTGDLLVEVHIEVPTQLTPEQKGIIEKL